VDHSNNPINVEWVVPFSGTAPLFL
jgi:hypothetical protein